MPSLAAAEQEAAYAAALRPPQSPLTADMVTLRDAIRARLNDLDARAANAPTAAQLEAALLALGYPGR